ncbi:alpha/beta fold hydrolase [Actinomadura sp. WAC 06369]|uniref:alpha/beta fold hydrolase n=1 Tax=Actinomadura sp. WAC 06369 TaxID=2203193 RepID=UPI000F78FFD9|nr:alpha/beta hydrolase [Actinomadura sp. WAC 06369]RSN64229.1 alpha/beta hydrolase [Actinomadura sp. WAC 06369]
MTERPTRLIDLDAGRVEYRLEERGPRTVLMLHGGHMRAGIALGEAAFTGAGHTVLAVSRPGYGRTPLATGTTPDRFAGVLADLCARLGIGSLAAVVGQSAGGPFALALADRHPDLVERLVLESAVGLLPWPDRRSRLAAGAVFHPRTEAVTWSLVHALARRAPGLVLRGLLSDLTTRRAADVLGELDGPGRAALAGLFGRMRSGSGFANDVQVMSAPDGVGRRASQAARLRCPALVIASRDDGSVPYAHARSLAGAIPDARLVPCTAPSHLIWFGDAYRDAAAAVIEFLAVPRTGSAADPAPPAEPTPS